MDLNDIRSRILSDCETILARYKDYPQSVHVQNARYIQSQVQDGSPEVVLNWYRTFKKHGFYLSSIQDINGPDDWFTFEATSRAE